MRAAAFVGSAFLQEKDMRVPGLETRVLEGKEKWEKWMSEDTVCRWNGWMAEEFQVDNFVTMMTYIKQEVEGKQKGRDPLPRVNCEWRWKAVAL